MNLDRVNLKFLYVCGELNYSVYKERLKSVEDDLGDFVSGEAIYTEPLPQRFADATLFNLSGEQKG